MEYGPLLCPLHQPTLCSRPVHSSLLVRVEGVTAAYFPVCFPDAQSHALMLKRHKSSYEAGHGFPSGAWRGMSGPDRQADMAAVYSGATARYPCLH